MKSVDEILREMRKMGENYSKSESNDCRYVAYWLGTTFADLIEAAVNHQFRDTTKTIPHLREVTKKEEVAVAENATTTPTSKDSLAVGDMAAMRKALSDACYAMFNFLKTHYGSCYEEMANALDKAKSALAKPPRNCDRFKPDEALSAYCEEKRIIRPLPLWYGNEFWAFIQWFFAEAKGETKSET